jgi:hypothetical protein
MVRRFRNVAQGGVPQGIGTAVQMEIDLAEDLRRAGYTVTGGH